MTKLLKIFLFIFILSFCHLLSFSQIKGTLSGYVNDAQTGKPLKEVIINVLSGTSSTSISTNDAGYYFITLNQGEIKLVVDYLGYATERLTLNLSANSKADIKLKPVGNTLDEVVISSIKKTNKVMSPAMGLEKLSRDEINKLPVLFGERDLVKALQLLPGVKNTGDGNGGFFVRGGAADQNLIVLDESIIYNPNHLLGFFSTFNADAIKEVFLYKGSMPAKYGGRLSSIMDVIMKDGNRQEYHVEGGVGLISSRLSFEGPIVKDKGSFFISGRRTYADVFLKASSDPKINENSLYFYDLNFKANYTVGAKDKLFFSAYNGNDKIGLGNHFGLDWGNTTAALRWSHELSPKFFSNSSLIYSNYHYDVSLDMASISGHINSNIKDWNIKQELKFYPNSSHSISIGASSIFHNIRPGTYTGDFTLADQPLNYSLESAIFMANNWKASEKLNLEYGLRLSAFSVLGGEQPFYTLNANNEIIKTTHYSRRQIAKTYLNVEPRISLSYLLNEVSSLKAAYSRNSQYLHLLSNTGSGNPTDKWISSNINIQPRLSDMYSLGYARNFKNKTYEFSIETYYKPMQNQIDYRDGANVLSNDPIDPQLLYGDGRAYGVEFLLRKNAGRLTGWIGYTLSRTEIQIPGINDGFWYPARQDRKHDITLVGMYNLSKKWDVSASFVYYTGNAVSFPSGKYLSDNQIAFYYTERNGYRMPAYQRLDLSATRKFQHKNNYTSELSFGLFNAYGHENAYSVTFRQDPDDMNKTQTIQTTLFKMVPSISYNFKF